MKKQSDTWVVILIMLNMAPEIQSKSSNIIILLSIPRPRPPKNIESFLYGLFQEMARVSAGIWMWDALDSSYVLNHMYICMIQGDMPGSAKLSSMAGHSAIFYGCNICRHKWCVVSQATCWLRFAEPS